MTFSIIVTRHCKKTAQVHCNGNLSVKFKRLHIIYTCNTVGTFKNSVQKTSIESLKN